MGKPETKRGALKPGRKTRSFLALPHDILDAPELHKLSGNAYKYLMDVASQYRGHNNGNLSMPWSRLKKRGWRSQTTAQKAKDELLNAGWILCTLQGGKHHCSLFAITWVAINEGPHHYPEQRTPSNAWKRPDLKPGCRAISAPVSGAITP